MRDCLPLVMGGAAGVTALYSASFTTEAPTLWKHGGRYYLFYSANRYDSRAYAIGYAIAESVVGPYHKPGGPLLASSILRWPMVIGPGGQDIVVGRDGRTWLLYHSWEPVTRSYRSLHMDELVWQGHVPLVVRHRRVYS